MRRIQRAALAGGVLVLLLAGAGCSNDPFRQVSGSVTLDGKPLPEGEIIFISPDNSTTPSTGPITNGTFRCKATVGAKKVQVNAVRDTGKVELGAKVYESIIPPKYNSQTTLTADVKDSGPNEFTFEVKSK